MKYKIQIILIVLISIFLLAVICKRDFRNTKEGRGLWVSRWEWAIKNGVSRVEVQQKRIIGIFEKAKQARMNFVVFQIRGKGDAFYCSSYEPWSDLLTGNLGQNPKWDPLAFALNQAHLRGLELHAWFNTFPAWQGKESPPHTEPEHVYNAFPEWLICDKKGRPMKLSSYYISLSPGIPAVRDYLHKVAMDIVENYDIDGFHFDYIRYPDQANKLGYSHDPVSVRLFNSDEGNPDNLFWEDWQRENINKLVSRFYDEATILKPWLKVSAAVIGKYDYSDWNGFHAVFQDAQKWLRDGKMDFIVPMIYWQTDHSTAPFDDIVTHWHKSFIHSRYIFPGISINKLGSNKWPVEELIKQVSISRTHGNGIVFFSYSGLLQAEKELDNKSFQYFSNIPPLSWKDNQPPMDPINLRINFILPGEVQLAWDSPDSSIEPTDVFRYNIFRSEKSPVDFMDAKNLIHITAGSKPVFYDSSVELGQTYYYIVTALDRVNNESPLSEELQVIVPQFVYVDSIKLIRAD